MWLFDGQFLKRYPFDDKENGYIPNAMLIGIAHENAINGVSQGTINTRPAKKAHLANFGATNAGYVVAPPQKISSAVAA